MKIHTDEHGINYFIMSAPINADLMFRTSSFGWIKFDVDQGVNNILIYNTLVCEHENPRDDSKYFPHSQQWKDIQKLIAHIPVMKAELEKRDSSYKNPYPKGVSHVASSNSREILIGTLSSQRFIYESKKNLKTALTYEDLDDAI